MTVLMIMIMTMAMVVTVVIMVVIAVSSTDNVQSLLQNSISDLHAADCLIEQGCQFLVSILSR
jgi:cbb3-type cytochrome oxidase cytochrome c subunit